MIIKLNSKRHVLYVGERDEDIEDYHNIVVLYNVTHVKHCGDGWYDIYREKEIMGHIMDVKAITVLGYWNGEFHFK